MIHMKHVRRRELISSSLSFTYTHTHTLTHTHTYVTPYMHTHTYAHAIDATKIDLKKKIKEMTQRVRVLAAKPNLRT